MLKHADTGKGNAGTEFFRKSISTFSRGLTRAFFQKPGAAGTYNCPDRFLMLIRWKIVAKFSQMERPIANNL